MAQRKPNHYEILGLNPDVGAEEIKRAYRDLVKRCHPDVSYRQLSERQRTVANERMRHINEAYETLKDHNKRVAYDYKIGARVATRPSRPSSNVKPRASEDAAREKFLKRVFHPHRSAIVKVLNRYKGQLSELSQDIYDEELLESFGAFVEELETTLRTASRSFTETPPPSSLSTAVQWMRHAIAQAADGLEELH